MNEMPPSLSGSRRSVAKTKGRPLDDAASLQAIEAHRLALSPLHEAGVLRATLWQFPPSLTSRALPHLLRAMETWPEDWPLAVEVRHDSWWAPGVGPTLARALRERNAAWVVADEPPKDVAHLRPDDADSQAMYEPRSPILTGDWFYLRWLGQHNQFPNLAETRLDATSRLDWWARKLLGVLSGGRVREIVGFFNNGYSGHSPASVQAMRRRLGLEVRPTPARRIEDEKSAGLLF